MDGPIRGGPSRGVSHLESIEPLQGAAVEIGHRMSLAAMTIHEGVKILRQYLPDEPMRVLEFTAGGIIAVVRAATEQAASDVQAPRSPSVYDALVTSRMAPDVVLTAVTSTSSDVVPSLPSGRNSHARSPLTTDVEHWMSEHLQARA